MAGVKRIDVNRLKDRLVLIKFKEAILWKGEDLQEIIYSKSSSWYDLLMWLLNQLCDNLNVANPKDILPDIHKTIVGLGIRHGIEAANLISGRITPEEQIKLLFQLISLVELKISEEDDLENTEDDDSRRIDQILLSLPEVLGPLEDRQESQSTAGIKKRNMPQPPQEPRKIESYAEDNSLCQVRVEKAKEQIKQLRKELELEDGVTASDAIKQLKKEREKLTDEISVLVESCKPLVQEVKHIFETELKDLLPVDVADPIDLTDINSLYEKVNCILQVQNNESALENCVTTLRKKLYNESPREIWSTEKSSSLPLFQLYEDSQYALKK